MTPLNGESPNTRMKNIDEPLHLVRVTGKSLDRWFPYDRYLRRGLRAVKHTIWPQPRSTGTQRWGWHLQDGLDRLGIPYDKNNFRALRKDESQVACVIGNVNALEYVPEDNPIVFGPVVPSHPDDFDWSAYPNIRAILVSCEWLAEVYRSSVSLPVRVWPAGIPTEEWAPKRKQDELIVYDKIRWDRSEYEHLVERAKALVDSSTFELTTFRHGSYLEEDFKEAVKRARGMIFLCESETQGFAYLQTLSSGTPILAYEDPGPWRDPQYYPERKVEATATPYWSIECGEKFRDADELEQVFGKFVDGVKSGIYSPRAYTTREFDLKKRSMEYIHHVEKSVRKNG